MAGGCFPHLSLSLFNHPLPLWATKNTGGDNGTCRSAQKTFRDLPTPG